MKRVTVIQCGNYFPARSFLALFLALAQMLALLPASAAPAGNNPAASVASPAIPEEVKVNRTLPRVTPAPEFPVFSASPADEEITRARIFGEPLLRTDEVSSVGENQALTHALLAYNQAADAEDVSSITEFLKQYPNSGWRASLLANLGVAYRRQGYFTKSLGAFEEAWSLTKEGRGKNALAVANWVAGELATIHTHLGHAERLEALFTELGDRDLHGPTTERITVAREALWRRREMPEKQYRCGPMSLARIRAHQGLADDPNILNAHATQRGMSLTQVAALAAQSRMNYQMAKRQVGAPILTPAVAHWKVDHYSAILERKEEGGKEYYLVQNPLFEGEAWVSRAALDEETSGYFLAPQGELPAGWRPVNPDEGSAVRGKCWSGVPDYQQTTCYAEKVGSDTCSTCPCVNPPPGMPRFSFHTLLVSLNIMDTPAGYTPPRGPAVRFTVTYNQREAFQPATFSFSNLGPKWTFNWLSYVTDTADQISPNGITKVYLSGAGQETYVLPGSATMPKSGGVHHQSQAELVAVSFERNKSAVYERRMPDGSKEIYSQSDGTTRGNRRVFLTQIVDPAGNAIRLTHDAQMRVVAVTDALGQVTTLSYELPGDPLKITKVTDPFGRSATLSYDAQGRLIKITDVIGLTSEFTYVANDFISSLKTPYGATSFRTGPGPEPNPPRPEASRYLQATDPLGETERLEYWGRVPGRTSEYGANLYWDKRAWRDSPKDVNGAPTDYTKARFYRWMLNAISGAGGNLDSGVKYSEKQPLESEIRYSYPPGRQNQQPDQLGGSGLPIKVTRALDDGTPQTYQFQHNDRGQITQFIDPAGRGYSFAYDANKIDLLEAYNDRTNEVLARISYNNQHLPLTYTDAAGQTTTFTYNSQGQITSATNPKGEKTTFTYDSRGYLMSVTGPVAGAVTSFTYDGFGRPRTITDSDGYQVTIEYDALDRPTKVTYPDGTFEQMTYDRLDATQVRDRLGRTTQATYDALRRVTSVTDPLGRVTKLEWCNCGDLSQLIDPAGNMTRWERDLQGRVTSKTLADGAQTRYVYEKNTSRLKRVIDAKEQVTNYQYTIDDNLRQISFTHPRAISRRPKISRPIPRNRGIPRLSSASQDQTPAGARTPQAEDEEEETEPLDAIASTPTVNFAYDPNYDRLTSVQDGTGRTTYSYHPVGRPGALQPAAVDGSLDNDTTTYTYDELGRVVNRAINGVTSSWAFDALGRVTSVTNPLGVFTLTYAGVTDRLIALRYPNGQMTTFSYLGNAGDQRLQQIKHQTANLGLISQFDYTYLATGEIQAITSQAPQSAPGQSVHSFSYDLAGHLTNAVTSGGANPANYAYAYDPAGNRTMEQINSVITSSSFNNTNQLLAQERGGATRRFTYDANGNLTGDGTRSFEWDALDRLITITTGVHRTEFSYDGLDRRTRIVEKENDVTVSDKRFVWCGDEICEERTIVGASAAVTKRFFEQGETQTAGGVEAAYFYTRDHLGSVREMADSRGAIVANYEYDPFGRMLKVGGDKDAAFGYADYFVHAPSGLNLTLYRAYDANLGRWLSRDPVGESEGPNLYEYVANDPVNLIDPSGGSLVSWLGGRAVRQGAKGLLRHYLRDRVGDRLRQITANKTRKEIAKELQDILDILDSDSVADVIIELVPGVGDVYGAARFCGKLQQALKRAEALDARVGGLLARKQVFLKFSSRKRMMDAPKSVGSFKDPRRKMKDMRPESHNGGSLHVHDKYHNSANKANIHYCVR